MKSDEIKQEIETLAQRFNQIVDEEKKIANVKQHTLMELQKLTGKYEAYLEFEKIEMEKVEKPKGKKDDTK